MMRNVLKISLMALVAMKVGLCAHAQNNQQVTGTKHEVDITIGMPNTYVEFVEGYKFIHHEKEGLIYGDKKCHPSFSVEYFYHITDVIGIGGIVTYSGAYCDLSKKTNLGEVKVGEGKHKYFSILPALKLDCIRKKHFGFYMKIGIGGSIIHETQKSDVEDITYYDHTKVRFNFQGTLLGLEWGNKHIRAFGELGMGVQGLLSGGLRYKF